MTNEYSKYLRLEELLRLQAPLGELSGTRMLAELFFIVAHQVSELWLKSLIAELEACELLLSEREPSASRAYQHARRALASALALEGSVKTLQHLDAEEFLAFRDKLGTASGAQSVQFARLRELVGLGVPQGGPIERQIRSLLRGQQREPSGRSALLDDGLEPYAPGRASETEWQSLLVTLRDVSSALWRWGLHHLDVVQRTIGRRTGTGGTTGASFLAANLLLRPFPTLWEQVHEPASPLNGKAAASGAIL